MSNDNLSYKNIDKTSKEMVVAKIVAISIYATSKHNTTSPMSDHYSI